MRILCFGDSNTYGYDPTDPLGGRYPAHHRWTDLLSQETGWKVLNRGENGRQIPHTPYLQEQVRRMLKANKSADLVIILLGTNDLLQGLSPAQTAARMDGFLETILPMCKKVLLIAPVPLTRGEWVRDEGLIAASLDLSRAYRAIAQKRNILFADAGLWNVALGFDGVHFSPEGHRTFAQQLQLYLQ